MIILDVIVVVCILIIVLNAFVAVFALVKAHREKRAREKRLAEIWARIQAHQKEAGEVTR
jgi:hypothetical protein